MPHGLVGALNVRLDAWAAQRRARVRRVLGQRPGLWAFPGLRALGLDVTEVGDAVVLRVREARQSVLGLCEPGQVTRSFAVAAMRRGEDKVVDAAIDAARHPR